jgi:single-strand DNA-binding protein
MSFNKIILVGNLTRDPEPGTLPNSETVTSRFTVATNAKVSGEDRATFFRVSLIGRQAELANEYLTKGRPVYIEGRLHLEEYVAQKGEREGQTVPSLEVRGTDMQFIGSKPEGQAMAATAGGSTRPTTAKITDDDIPF